MLFQAHLSRSSILLAALVAAGACAAASAQAQPRAARSPTVGAAVVHGLIVQLHGAPSHLAISLARASERAASRDGQPADAASHAARESDRWQRLVTGLQQDDELVRELPAWQRRAPSRDPVGASAQLLRFPKPLSREQAERVAARLSRLPEVAWVTPNVRERRQARAQNAPDDPYFAAASNADGQWWLQAVGQGGNTSPIAGRLRGVPGFLPAWLNGSNGSAAAVVAVLDSGITCHPDLGNLGLGLGCIGGSILPGYDFVADWDAAAQRGYANDGDGRDADPRDPGDWVSAADRSVDPARYGSCDEEPSSWHGSIIAGIVAAQTNNGAGVAAINWHGRVLPVRVAGKCGAEVADIIEGMRWAAGLPACKRSDGAGGCEDFAPANPNPARIVNISFGGNAACSAAYQQAIDELRAAPFADGSVGAVVVAAAGNGWGAPSRPANCQRVIGVAALNRDGFKANYSNFGATLAIATVGGDDNLPPPDGDSGAWASRLADSGILTIGNGALTGPADCTATGANCYYNHFGTSFSAPIVSGAISLMLSVNPALTVSEIERGLARSARPHVTFPTGVANLGLCSNANPGRCQCTAATCGAGILDAAQALSYAADPAGYVNTRTVGDPIDTKELRAAAELGPDRPANPPAPPPSNDGGGGGAVSAGWLLALALAAWGLRRRISAAR